MDSYAVMREDLDLLAGKRPRNPGAAAVRKEDMAQFAPADLKSAQLTDAPTMDDYNALQADIAALHAAMTKLSSFTS